MMTNYSTPSNILFLLMLLLSTMMMVHAESWIFLWLGMEVNMMSFIPLILHSSKSRKLESAIKYFLVQTVGSILMLTSMMNQNMLNLESLLMYMFTISILMKMGAAPFHRWLPQVVGNMSWMNCFLILTWQKIGPIMILASLTLPVGLLLFNFVTIMNSLVGTIGGLSQTQMRPLLAYSSISHMAWMLAVFLVHKYYIAMYFAFYCFLTMVIMLPLMSMDKHSTNNFNLSHQPKNKTFFLLGLNMLSLGGMPPLLGFFPKFFVGYLLVPFVPLLVTILLLMSMISLFYYMKVLISSFINMSKMMNPSSHNQPLMSVFMMMQMFLPFPFITQLMSDFLWPPFFYNSARLNMPDLSDTSKYVPMHESNFEISEIYNMRSKYTQTLHLYHGKDGYTGEWITYALDHPDYYHLFYDYASSSSPFMIMNTCYHPFPHLYNNNNLLL